MSLPISFISDFGTEDEFVGVVHGVLAKLAPVSRVIDITHGIRRGEVRAGALALVRAIQYLPEGVALAVVDPGVGTERRAIAARTPWGFFVGPDNGLLSPGVAMVGGADVIVAIENPEVMIPSRGATFAGRDVLAPAAGVLASGEADLRDLGPEVDPDSVFPLLLPLPDAAGNSVRGEAWWIDHFGNVQTNVGPDDLHGLGAVEGEHLVFMVGNRRHSVVWASTYGDVSIGEALLHTDSSGLISVAVRGARADERFGLADGTVVTISKE
ncbi:MAG: hypothetical protein GWP04_12590 [Gammaproteobacteria bacterium]|nr:hypothetical protein [Gammaproteobacteria bacterium]